MNTCIATMQTVNISIKAQKALASEGIFSKIISIDPALTRRGCAYGIEFSCAEEATVRRILRQNGIKNAQFLNFSGGKTL